MDELDYSDTDDVDDVVEPVADDVLATRESNTNAFRATLLAWKSKHIDDVTRGSQNTTVLNKYLRESAELYKAIKDKLEGRTDRVNVGELDVYLNVDSGMERANLLSAAYSDLVEFPFTYRRKLIDAFPKTNSLEHAEIIPNE